MRRRSIGLLLAIVIACVLAPAAAAKRPMPTVTQPISTAAAPTFGTSAVNVEALR